MRTLLAFVLLSVAPVRAGLNVTLAPIPQVVEEGTELIFAGALTNTSATDRLFLNDIQATLSGDAAAYLTLKSNAFFANAPGVLLPGETYSGVIFRVAVSRLTPVGSYPGTVTLRGGADGAALSDLASASFEVASPFVGIVATDPFASELGPENGLFTVSRTGSTGTAVTVTYSTSGTAVNGVTYNSVSSPVTIPSGASSVTIAIAPIPDNLAQGDRTATFSLAGSTYNLGANNTADVTVFDRPIDEWRAQEFGVAANDPPAADTADAEKDGISNLLEYALNLEPLSSDRPPLPVVTGGYLTFTFSPNPLATDIAYAVEASTDLLNWSTANVEQVISAATDPLAPLLFRYKTQVSLTNRAYLRLQVTR